MTGASFDSFDPMAAAGALQARLDKRDFLRRHGIECSPADTQSLEQLAAPLAQNFADSLQGAQAASDPSRLPPGTRFPWLKGLLQRALQVYSRGQVDFNRAALSALEELGKSHRATQEALNRLILDRSAAETRIAQAFERLDQTARETRKELSRLHELGESQAESLTALQRYFAGVAEEEYAAFETEFRGSEIDVAAKQAQYVELFRKALAGSNDALNGRLIVDAGCGRGEFLETLGKAGFKTLGLDINSAMVERCRAKGLNAKEGNALALLEEFDDESLAGVVSLQVVEHLTMPEIASLFAVAWRKLHPRGLILIETINPESVYAMRWFYMDWTHKRPLPSPLMEFLMHKAGFLSTEIIRTSPVETWRQLGETGIAAVDQTIRKLNGFLFGFQDYAVVGRKQTAQE